MSKNETRLFIRDKLLGYIERVDRGDDGNLISIKFTSKPRQELGKLKLESSTPYQFIFHASSEDGDIAMLFKGFLLNVSQNNNKASLRLRIDGPVTVTSLRKAFKEVRRQ